MPIYEYQCNACGHTLEALQKMSEEPLKDCPNCNQASLQKLVSSTSFQLKGSGWYATDFKNKSEATTKKETPSTDTKIDAGTTTAKSDSATPAASKPDTSDKTGT